MSDKLDKFFKSTRGGRIATSSAAIAWSAVFLVFFTFFSKYLAYYEHATVDGVTKWNIYPLLTADFNAVLPILTTTLILCIVGHIVLIILDKYLLRQITVIVLYLLGMATVLTFLRVFPFDFSVIPNADIAAIMPTVAIIALILISIGLGVGALVTFIRLMINVSRQKTSQGKLA